MPSNHLILCCPLLLLPSVFPRIRVFSRESVLHIRWLKYWSLSFSISPFQSRWVFGRRNLIHMPWLTRSIIVKNKKNFKIHLLNYKNKKQINKGKKPFNSMLNMFFPIELSNIMPSTPKRNNTPIQKQSLEPGRASYPIMSHSFIYDLMYGTWNRNLTVK